MAFCNQCGTELPDGARFCAKCGAAVGGAASAATAIPPAQPTFDPAAQSFRQPAQPVAGGGGGLGWILPALVGIAALAIAYLIFAPKPAREGADTGTVTATKAGGDASEAAGGGTEQRDRGSSAAAAGEAADIAGANARAASGTVSAPVLDSAFFSNPDGAAVRYAGPIRVAGTIATMVQPGPTPALSMEGRTRFNYMVVNFPEGYRERLAPLSKGQFITVSCQEVRGLGGTTILSGCLLD